MSETFVNAAELDKLSTGELWEKLGKVVRSDSLGILPEEEEGNPTDEQVGYWYYKRQLSNIKKIYCNEVTKNIVSEEKSRDVTVFVSSLIDLFAAYFGLIAGTIILVQIYKIGVDRFCEEAEE